ncbi:MAG: T9SS type A sorting domain-containing protein [Ignavibacteriales bacterium]|nr:T9SS type A sorting domain-containing protein [Ignavibacteriales bacterium]
MWPLYGSSYIFRSTNNGATWDSVYSCIDSSHINRIYDIVTDNNDQLFAIGSLGIVSSTDNGNSWVTHNAGLTTNDVSAIEKNSEGEIFVGTPDGVYICVKKTPTGVINDKEILPKNFILSQNYPNPFNPVTTIKYQIPHRSNVSLKIYDLLGNEVADLVNEEQEVGFYNIDFDASKFSSGVYFYRIQAGDFVQTKKMILLK